jgi:hypothetical protein
MGLGEEDSSQGDEGGAGAVPRRGVGTPAGATCPETHKLSYQVILRHLAKFRDGAQAIQEMLDTHTLEPAEPTKAAATTVAADLEPKSPLELRIERHMSSVDRALLQIKNLNPDHRSKAELPPEIRDQLVIKERTIHDIVGAELHFWAAAIENSPLDRLDDIEQKWVARIIGLADLIGVDADHEEHLVFLKDWLSHKHS